MSDYQVCTFGMAREVFNILRLCFLVHRSSDGHPGVRKRLCYSVVYILMAFMRRACRTYTLIDIPSNLVLKVRQPQYPFAQ